MDLLLSLSLAELLSNRVECERLESGVGAASESFRCASTGFRLIAMMSVEI